MSTTPNKGNAELDITAQLISPISDSFTHVSFKKLTIWSFNVNRKWATMSETLDHVAGYVDIIMFQEPAWRGVRRQPSTIDKDGDVAHGPPIPPSWIPLHEAFDPTNESRPRPRVLTYVNKLLSNFRPLLRTDIIKHRDISLITLFERDKTNDPHPVHFLNVY